MPVPCFPFAKMITAMNRRPNILGRIVETPTANHTEAVRNHTWLWAHGIHLAFVQVRTQQIPAQLPDVSAPSYRPRAFGISAPISCVLGAPFSQYYAEPYPSAGHKGYFSHLAFLTNNFSYTGVKKNLRTLTRKVLMIVPNMEK